LTLGHNHCYNELFGGSKIYAIIETGGKQYKVAPGQTIEVERLKALQGDTVELDKVLFIADGDKITVGTPVVEGAKVIATSQGESKGEKVIAFKYKSKVRYQRKIGHRQLHTKLVIDKIVGPGMAEVEPPKKKVRRRKKEVKANGA